MPRPRASHLPAAALAGLLAAPLGILPPAGSARADPSRDILWAALQTCRLAMKATGRPFPCLTLDPGGAGRPGTAVLRAPGARTHAVLMPIDTVSGLEDPVLQGPRGAAYWQAALAARHYVSDALAGGAGHLSPDLVALAVNSEGGRSQDQLHIHLDCVRPSVLASLRRAERDIREDWTRLPGLPGGHYYAMRVPREAETFNPFIALTRLPGRTDLTETSLAALAAPADGSRPGILLATRGPIAHAEELLDHACRLAVRPRPHDRFTAR